MKKSLIALSMAFLASSALTVGGAFAQTQIAPKLPEPGWAPPGSPVAVHGALKAGKISGKGAVLDKDGNAVVLRGMSLFWANTPEGNNYYTEATIGWLIHDWRTSVIRAAIASHTQNMGNPGYADGAAGSMTGMARTVIESAIQRGIYVIVDWHMHNNTLSNGTDKAVEFFGIIARDYGKYPNVIYEVWNEPIEQGWSEIKTFSEKVIKDGIRAKNSPNLVVVGSPKYSSQPNQAVGNQVTDAGNNTAYSIHFYAASHAYSASQGGGWWQNHGYNMNSAIDAGLAVFATEWGSVKDDGGLCPESNPNCTPDPPNTGASNTWVAALDEKKVGWAYWSVNNKNESASILKMSAPSTGWTDNDLRPSGLYIRPIITTKNTAAYPNWAKTYSVTATAGSGGSVMKKVGGAVSNGPYNFGDQVTVIAVPNSGYEFAYWEGDASGGKDTVSYKVIGVSVSLNAVFVPTSLVKNGYFSNNIDNWNALGVVLGWTDGALKAAVNSGGSATTRVYQSGIRIEANKKYTLSFKAKSESGARQITARLTNSGRNVNYMEDTAAVTLGANWETYTKTFTTPSSLNGNAVDASSVLFFACGSHPNDAWTWYLDDVVMNPADGSTPIRLTPAVPAARRAVWSISKTGGELRLRGPNEAGAKLSLYDARGKRVMSAAAKDGLTLNAKALPAGGYIAVVRNGAGAETMRSKVVTTR